MLLPYVFRGTVFNGIVFLLLLLSGCVTTGDPQPVAKSSIKEFYEFRDDGKQYRVCEKPNINCSSWMIKIQ